MAASFSATWLRFGRVGARALALPAPDVRPTSDGKWGAGYRRRSRRHTPWLLHRYQGTAEPKRPSQPNGRGSLSATRSWCGCRESIRPAHAAVPYS
jgi:hypothetical protein